METQVKYFGNTKFTNCSVTSWSPAQDSLNFQWLQGTTLTPIYWAFEVLALESAQRVRCHIALQNLHLPPCSKVDQKKRPTESRWCKKDSPFCYLPGAAKRKGSLYCGRFFSGGPLNMQNTAGKQHMQAVFPDRALLCTPLSPSQ